MHNLMATFDEKQAFSDRLNLVLDEEGFPEKWSGRQSQLAENWGLTQNGVRRWLEGESIPEMTRLIEMAKRYNVNFEWLATGRDPVTLQPSNAIVREILATRAADEPLYSHTARKLIADVKRADKNGVPAEALKTLSEVLRFVEMAQKPD